MIISIVIYVHESLKLVEGALGTFSKGISSRPPSSVQNVPPFIAANGSLNVTLSLSTPTYETIGVRYVEKDFWISKN
jgi:hypothetical protein